MLPHKHFLIAEIIILIIGLFFPLSFIGLVKWVLIGGLFAVLIDIDSAILSFFSKELKNYRNVFKKYDEFMNLLVRTGLIKLLVLTHLLISAVFILGSYLYFDIYLIPISAGVISHLISDMWELRKFIF